MPVCDNSGIKKRACGCGRCKEVPFGKEREKDIIEDLSESVKNKQEKAAEMYLRGLLSGLEKVCIAMDMTIGRLDRYLMQKFEKLK